MVYALFSPMPEIPVTCNGGLSCSVVRHYFARYALNAWVDETGVVPLREAIRS